MRALQAEVLGGTQLKWQVLVIQPVKNAPEFRGKLRNEHRRHPGRQALDDGLAGRRRAPLQFRQYRRVEGMVDLPPRPW